MLSWASLLASSAHASTFSVPNTFVAHTPILSSAVNANFAAIVTAGNNIDNTNITAGANIAPTKINHTATWGTILLAASTAALGAGNTGDTQPRVVFTSDGWLQFGPGGASAVDRMFRRDASVGGIRARTANDAADTGVTASILRGTNSSTALIIADDETAAAGKWTLGVNGAIASGVTRNTYLVNPGTATTYMVLCDTNSLNAAGSLVYLNTNKFSVNAIPTAEGQPVFANQSAAPTYVSAPFYAGGRLTLVTANPEGTDVSNTNVFYTPYVSNLISLHRGSSGGTTGWSTVTFTQKTLAVPNVANQMYDVFGYYDTGELVLEALAWTNDTTRATALAYQDGILVKTGDPTRRYLGSFRTTAVAGQTTDTSAQRFLWNMYNRVPRNLYATDTTASWTYNTATWRAANANTTAGEGRTEFITGVAGGTQYAASYHATYGNSGAASVSLCGIALNSTTVPQAAASCSNGQTTIRMTGVATIQGFPTVGYKFIQNMEIRDTNSATNTWYGVQPTTSDVGSWQEGTISGM